MNDSRPPHHHFQQHPSPEVGQLLRCSSLHGKVELQVVTSKSCCCHQYRKRRPPNTTADYRWVGGGHASPDVYAGDTGVRLNLALPKRGQDTLVGDLRNHQTVVQEMVEFPRMANGYYGVVVGLKKKESAHRPSEKIKRRQNDLGHYKFCS